MDDYFNDFNQPSLKILKPKLLPKTTKSKSVIKESPSLVEQIPSQYSQEGSKALPLSHLVINKIPSQFA